MGKDNFNVELTDKLLQRLIVICCCVLMFSDVAGVSSVKVSAYIGQAAKLVSNSYSHYEDPSLYNETETLIALWKGTTNTVSHMDPHYSGKIYMDKERNIWILGVEREDAGIYYLNFGIQIERHEIILIVMGNHDSIIGLLITIMILVIMILVILIIIIVLLYKDWIRKCWKAGKNRIQEKLSSEHTKVVVINEGSELTEHQVRNWLEGHPEFLENNKSLTEFLVKSWLKLHPDFIKKYDEHENYHQSEILSLHELNVTVKDIKANQRQCVSTEMEDIASETDEHENYHQYEILSLHELNVTVKDINAYQRQCVSTEMEDIASETDVLVNYDPWTKPTLNELAITLCGLGTGTEDNLGQLELSSTCNSHSSGTFSEPDHSGAQPFNYDEQDANSEQDTAQDVGEVKEDSDTEDKCQEPLLTEGSC